MVTPEFTCSRASRLSRNTSKGKALVVRAAEGNKVMLEGGELLAVFPPLVGGRAGETTTGKGYRVPTLLQGGNGSD